MSKLQTALSFRCARFKPTSGELDDTHDDFINPGVFAKEASDWLAAKLTKAGYRVRESFPEDWGRWIEIDNPDGYFLAVGVSNFDPGHGDGAGETHRVFIEPDKSPIRKWFKVIETEARVMKLLADVRHILATDDEISNIEAFEG